MGLSPWLSVALPYGLEKIKKKGGQFVMRISGAEILILKLLYCFMTKGGKSVVYAFAVMGSAE